MTWRGALRSIQADMRRMEREAQRRQRELERTQISDQAAYEVRVYENRVDLLTSVHKECGANWDWENILAQKPPEPPLAMHNNEDQAQEKLRRFMPNIFDKLLGRIDSKRTALSNAVETAKEQDKASHAKAISEYEDATLDWQEAQKLAGRITSGDEAAYLEAIEETNPFSDISALGSSLSFSVTNKSIIEVAVHVNDEDAIPREIKSQLKSGKLSVKKMPKAAFYELYQDYICGCALRVARETLALLPIEIVIVNAIGKILNTKTGYVEEQPILSVAIPGKTLESLNLETIDPSDSMGNFVHNMDFKKTSGFRAVEKINPSALQ